MLGSPREARASCLRNAEQPSVGSALQQHFVHLRAPVEPSHARLFFDQITMKPALRVASRAWARLYTGSSLAISIKVCRKLGSSTRLPCPLR